MQEEKTGVHARGQRGPGARFELRPEFLERGVLDHAAGLGAGVDGRRHLPARAPRHLEESVGGGLISFLRKNRLPQGDREILPWCRFRQKRVRFMVETRLEDAGFHGRHAAA